MAWHGMSSHIAKTMHVARSAMMENVGVGQADTGHAALPGNILGRPVPNGLLEEAVGGGVLQVGWNFLSQK